MKKLLLIFGCLLSVLVLAQETDIPYDFPVKPGTEQWAKLSSSDEMNEVCIIPDQILRKMSTKALFITCLNYPRLIEIFLADNLQAGFDFYVDHFSGLKELVKRSDLKKVLLQAYINLDIPSRKMIDYDLKLSYIHPFIIELLISQEVIINQYNKNEKFELLTEAIKKLEQRQMLGQSFFSQLTSALILSRILSSEKIYLSADDQFENTKYKIFNSTAFPPDSVVINKLLIESKKIKGF